MSSDDSQLMRQVQAGEFRSFDLLVERYRPALLRVAAGMLGDQGLAEDVVQETFLAVFAARHTFDPAFHFRTWLWTILLNFCRRHAARRGRANRSSWSIPRSPQRGAAADAGDRIAGDGLERSARARAERGTAAAD